MPHFVIEYSQNLEEQTSATTLMDKVFTGGIDSELFAEKDIKVRAIAYNQQINGANLSDFIHISSKILSGRNSTQKSQLSAAVLAQLQSLELKNTSITVEVLDMDKESYAKAIS